MEKWKTYRYDSQCPLEQLVLNENNHIINAHDRILEIYGIEPEHIEKPVGYEHRFTAWKNENILYGDIVLHYDGTDMYWEPFVEYFIRKGNLEELKPQKYTFGYIAGTMSPFGGFKASGMSSAGRIIGYTMWEKFDNKDKIDTVLEQLVKNAEEMVRKIDSGEAKNLSLIEIMTPYQHLYNHLMMRIGGEINSKPVIDDSLPSDYKSDAFPYPRNSSNMSS